MVSDLIIPRVEFNGFHNVLHWSPDGSIALNTSGQISIYKPKHTKEITKSSAVLFDLVKVDIEKLPVNQLFDAEMSDERTGTLFTASTQSINKLQWSPLYENVSYLAILTSYHGVYIIRDGNIWLDVTTKEPITSQAQFDQQKTHSFGWIATEHNLLLCEGLASGHIRTIDIFENEEQDFLKVSDHPIVHLKVVDNVMFAVSSKNEIFKIDGSKVEQLKDADRSMIYDIYVDSTDTVFYTTYSKLHKLSKNDSNSANTGLTTPSQVFPCGQSKLLLIAQSKTAEFTYDLEHTPNDTTEPLLKKRIQRWNSKFNDFNTRTPLLKIYGASLNFSGNVLAVLYELEQDAGFKYQISSENTYKVMFVTLDNHGSSKGSSLAHFQEFKITGTIRDVTPEKITPDYGTDFSTFIRESVNGDSDITKWASQNLIYGDKDELIKKKYATLLLNYIKKNKLTPENIIDKAVINNLHIVAGLNISGEVTDVPFTNSGFTETFDFVLTQNPESMRSKTDNEWPTCSLTFLPILTTAVRVDPVSGRRFIDLTRDTENDYGTLTKAILSASDISIYSGCRFVVK